MAWTVAFALLGAVIFSMTIAPVLASFLFRKEIRDWHNPVLVWLTEHYRRARDLVHPSSLGDGWALRLLALCCSLYSGIRRRDRIGIPAPSG